MRIFIGILSLVAVLMVGALIAPQFVDWNKYKPQITTQVEKATGLKVTIDGGLSMSVFPMPHVKIGDLTVASPNKQEFENLLKMKSAEVSVELMPLLRKEVKVSRVTLVEPDITIEILEDGTASWETEKLKSASMETSVQSETEEINVVEAPSQSKLESVALDKLEIQGGKIVFVNHGTKARYEVRDVNAAIKASSLKGPFSGEGNVVYNDREIQFDIETDKLPKEGALPIEAAIKVPDVGGVIKFNGVVALSGPLDVQGQTSVKTDSIGGLLSVVNGKNDGSLNQDLAIEGLVSATENQIKFDNLKVSTDDFTGNGKFSVQNLQAKNPLLITGDIQSSTALNLNPFLKKSSSKAPNETTSKGSATDKSSSNQDIVSSSLTLPMAIDANIKMDVAGLRFNKNNLRGVAVDLNKAGKGIKASFNVKEMPGQAKASGALSIDYASSSQSSKTGQVTYSDPAIKYNVEGNIGQLSSFLSEFAPDVDAKAITKNYNSAQFNLNGAFNGGAIELKDSVVKLDDTVIGLGGSYKPATSTSRAAAVIEVRADTIDFDKFSKEGSKKSSSSESGGGPTKISSKDKSDALKPLQNLSLPLDLDFDVSVQKARIGGKDLSGLLADGKITSNKLSLDTLSVNDYAGATLSVKGAIANLKELSGLDLTGYIKTDDLKSFANTMNIDVSKIPASVNKLEASIEGKGNISDVSFASNIKALGGSLDASGRAKNALKTTELSDLILRVVHPNANNAIKAISPNFKGSDPLKQAIDFYANVNSNGKIYDLTGIKAKLGPSDFTGNLKIDMSSKVTGISGNINAGKIALDSLLGTEGAKNGSSSGESSSSGSSSSSSSKGKWSDDPIDLSWMNSNNINVVLSAENLTYGKWSFTKPSTELKISGGTMTVRDLQAGVFGGTAKLDTTVKASPVSIDLSSTMNGIDLEKLAGALSNSNRLKARGNVSFSVDVKGAGNSSRALVSSLNGKSNVDGTNIVLEGFDLAKIAQALSRDEKFINSLQGFASGALDGGETQFDTLDGDYDISNGVVKISKMVLDGPVAMINSDGQADLPKWYIAVNNYVSLKGVEDFEPVNIEVKGSISNPKTFGKNILEDYLEDKIKRKLGKELPDLLGDDVSNTLQQFGIIPKQEKPVENTDLNDVIEQEANDNAPAPQPVKEEPKKPEDALKDILGGESPEDAVNDLIKGLF